MASLKKIEAVLEANGFLRKIAGDTDFDAALLAVETALDTKRGIIVSGKYGCGKTKFLEALTSAFLPLFKVRLGVKSELEKFDPKWQEYWGKNPYASHVYLDDIGAESTTNEFGAKVEVVSDFLMEWEVRHEPGYLLFLSTNYNAVKFDDRYGGRVSSRIKDLCVPLHFTGGDKRSWVVPKNHNRVQG